MRNTFVTQMAEPYQNSREAPPRKQSTKLCALASFRDIKNNSNKSLRETKECHQKTK